jgi:hypothetical protein
MTRSNSFRPLGLIFALLGLITALAPRLIYQAFEAMPGMTMQCLVTANAEIFVGSAVVLLGAGYLLLSKAAGRLAVSLAAALLAATALFLPLAGTGLCGDTKMPCHLLTLPLLTVSSVLLLLAAATGIILSLRSLKQAKQI